MYTDISHSQSYRARTRERERGGKMSGWSKRDQEHPPRGRKEDGHDASPRALPDVLCARKAGAGPGRRRQGNGGQLRECHRRDALWSDWSTPFWWIAPLIPTGCWLFFCTSVSVIESSSGFACRHSRWVSVIVSIELHVSAMCSIDIRWLMYKVWIVCASVVLHMCWCACVGTWVRTHVCVCVCTCGMRTLYHVGCIWYLHEVQSCVLGAVVVITCCYVSSVAGGCQSLVVVIVIWSIR